MEKKMENEMETVIIYCQVWFPTLQKHCLPVSEVCAEARPPRLYEFSVRVELCGHPRYYTDPKIL